MTALLSAFAVSFGVVFVAELGDKSQLLSLAFTTRYGWRTVLVGIAMASVVMHGLAVLVGGALGTLLPERLVQAAGGVAFLVFGALSLRPEEDEDEELAEAEAAMRRRRPAVATVTGSFLVAEFGDKTQLAALALAGTYPALGVWPGAAAGMVAANAIVIAAAALIGARLPERALRLGAAGLFFLFGVLLLVEAVRG